VQQRIPAQRKTRAPQRIPAPQKCKARARSLAIERMDRQPPLVASI
jgi:hypothetical protein